MEQPFSAPMPPPARRPPNPSRQNAITPTDTARLDADLEALGLTGVTTMARPDPQRPPTPRWQRLTTWVAIYGVALALIGFWPQPVDSGAGALLRLVTKLFPLLTYDRIEFGSNILLFVPLGVGLALLIPRARYLVMPVALLASLTIESVQAVYIEARTPSVYDIIANVSGAALGLVAVAAFEAWRRRRRHRGGFTQQRESTMDV